MNLISLCWFATSVAALSISGCSSNAGTSTRCLAGDLRCACYGNQTCNQGLECRSDVCVAIASGTNVGGNTSSVFGTTAAGGVSTAGGTTNGGGSSPLSGASAIGGISSTNGTVVSGGASSAVGTNAIGGITSAGGTTNSATSVVIGGNSAVGGSSTNGGLSAIGGGTSTGGAADTTAGGGNSAIGGVTSTGGTASPGGGTFSAGQSSIGGTSSAGQSSTGGTLSNLRCGDGIVNDAESCDTLPKNNDMGDGCSPNCTAEPICPGSGGACVTQCGDGIVHGTEECDDGNVQSGDGCSSACKVEVTGFQCSQPVGGTMVVPMVVRDFNAGADFEKGAGFATDLNFANQGWLQTTLDSNGLKPILVSTIGTYNGTTGQDSGIASKASFAQWYDDKVTGPNTYHATLASSLTLYASDDGSAYANRFGNNGDGLTSAKYERTYGLTDHFCGNVGMELKDGNGVAIPCTECIWDDPDTADPCDTPLQSDCTSNPSYLKCVNVGSMWYGVYVQTEFDGNPLWFPADSLTPANPSSAGQVAGNFDPGWPTDPSGKLHNFSFTTEVRFWFKFDSTNTYTLSFLGDDDAWVFVNKHLAIDIGGIHTPVKGELTISGGVASVVVTNALPTDTIVNIRSAPDLGTLQDGGLYEVVVFQAERQTRASTYALTVSSSFVSPRTVCTPQ